MGLEKMTVCYIKLRELLIDGDMKKDLCEVAGIGPGTITKVGKGGTVNAEKICNAINYNIGYIMEITNDENVEEGRPLNGTNIH